MEIYQRQVESVYGCYEYYDSTENHGAVNDGGGFGRVFKGVFRKYSNTPIEIKMEDGNIVNRQFERNLVDGETVAVKVIFGEHSDRENVLYRMREGVALQVDSKNVVKMYAFLHKKGTYHEIMEFIEGIDLSEIIGDAIERKKPLSFEFVYPIIHQVLSGLTAIHNRNAVHRDLDVTNIRISLPLNDVGKVTQNQILPIDGNEVKIIDMGIAHRMDKRGISIPGAKLGKLNYMCPEQIDGKTPEPNWDLYALGMCIYEIFTENLPFEKGNIEKTTQLIRTEKLPPHSNLPQPLYELLKTATAKNANERFGNVDEFCYEWEQLPKRIKNPTAITWYSQLTNLRSLYIIGGLIFGTFIYFIFFYHPKTETPKTETPKTETPKTETPKTVIPKTETPKTETPKKVIPKTETPKTETPKTSNGKEIASMYDEVKRRFSSTFEDKGSYATVKDATGTSKRLAVFDRNKKVIELNINPEIDDTMDVFDENLDGYIDR